MSVVKFASLNCKTSLYKPDSGLKTPTEAGTTISPLVLLHLRPIQNEDTLIEKIKLNKKQEKRVH